MSRSKLGLMHGSRLPLLTEFPTKVPHPLRQDLPELLTVRRVRAPSVAALLPILISKYGLEAPSMQVEPHDISSGEAEGGQGCEEQLIDDLIAGDPNRTSRASGRMGCDNHPTPLSLCGHRQFPTVKQIPAGATFGMCELLVRRQGAFSLGADQATHSLCRVSQSLRLLPSDPLQ